MSLLTLFASVGFAQDGLQPAAPTSGVDEKLITSIHQTAERLLGANRFLVTSSEVTTASDQSTVVEGMSTFAGRAETYFKAVFNQAGKINYFYAGAPAGGAFDPYGLTEAFIKDPQYASLYLPNALRRRLAFDSYTAKIDNASPTINEVTVGFRLMEDWPLFPLLGIQLDKVVVEFTIKKPATTRELSGTLAAVNSWDTDTILNLYSNLTNDPKEWEIKGELKNLSIRDVMERLKIDDLVNVPIPGPVLDQKVNVASIALKPFGQELNILGLTSLGNLQIIVENESFTKKKTDDEMTEEYLEWANSDEVYDFVQTGEKEVSKWSFMAAYSLPEDFRFANFVPELGVLDQFQLFNAGLVISTAEKELDTELPIFQNLGKGNTKVYKGLTFIAIQNLEHYEIDKTVGNLSDVSGIQSVLFRGNIPIDIQNLSLEAALTFTDDVNIGNALWFRNLKLFAKPAAQSPEFTLFADIGLKMDAQNTLEFTGGLGLEPLAATVKLVARQNNAWVSPYGFKGISVGPFELQAGVNFSVAAPYPIPDNMIIGGAMVLGDFEGQAIIGFDVNSLNKNMLSVSFNHIGLLDVVDGFVGPQIAGKIPPYVRDEMDVDVDSAEFTFVPPGYAVNTALGTFDEGFRVAGKAKIVKWRGDLDITLEPPSSVLNAGLTAAAHMDPIKINAGDLKVFHLTGAHGEGRPTWEVNLSTDYIINQGANSRLIYVNGGLNILDVGKGNALIELTPQGYMANLDGKVYGFLDAELEARISQFTNPLNNTYVKVNGKTGSIMRSVQGFLTQEILNNAFELRSVSFEGDLDALQSGAEAQVVFKLAGNRKSITVHVDAKDGAKFFENLGKEIVNAASPILQGIIAAKEAAEAAARQAADEARRAALATAAEAQRAAQQAAAAADQARQQAAQVAATAQREADQAFQAAQQQAQQAAQNLQNVTNTIGQQADQAANFAADQARRQAREAEKTARDVGKFFASGATAAVGFGQEAIQWTRNFATNLTSSVASIFEGNQRSRIKTDVPAVWIEHQGTGQIVYCVDCNNGQTDLRLRPRSGSESEEWQILPANDLNYNYIVSKASGLNIHMHGKDDAEGQLYMRKHATEDKFKEKIEFVPATADGIWYRMQYKQRPFYVTVDASGKLDISLDVRNAALFRVLIPGDEAAAARQAELAAQQAADAARARVQQERQPLLTAAQQAAAAAQQQVQTARSETMAAYQARINAANQAAAAAQRAADQAQQDAQRAAAAAGTTATPTPTPSTPVPSVPAASPGAVSNETARGKLIVPGTTNTSAQLTKMQDGVILKNGEFELRWQRDGNLVVYRNGNQPTWASGTNGRADRLAWQADGNLVIYLGNRAIWATGTADSQQNGQGGTLLRLNNRGHLVVRNANRALWRSNGTAEPEQIPTSVDIGHLPVPGDSDQEVATLSKSQDGVILKNGAFVLRWQSDGNLVVYQDGNRPTWASNTYGRADLLAWQGDGNLVIYMGNRAVWATATADSQRGGRGGRKLTLRSDGVLTISDAAGQTIWTSR